MKQLFRDIELQFGKEAAEKSYEVVKVVRAKVVAKNLFGWRYWMEDHLTGLIGYMIQTGFEYSGGAYVACGMQGAIDHCRYCNAQKRRGDYELVSLDEFFQVEDKHGAVDKESQANELVMDISIKFGADFAEQLKPFLCGYEKELSKEVLAKCQSIEFIEWFKNYMGM